MHDGLKAAWVCWRLMVVFCAFCGTALSQELEFPKSPTLWVDCGTGDQKPEARDIVGPVFVAKSGQHRAKAKVKVKVKGYDCHNTTTLWFSEGTTLEFKAAYTQLPIEPDVRGNGMQIVDWSPDGKLLLTELWQWNTMANDADFGQRIIVFNPQHNKHFEVDLKKLQPDPKAECLIQYQLLGFTSDSWVALKTKVSTFYSVDDTIDGKPPDARCELPVEVLKIDPQTQERLPLPKDFQPEKYSTKMKDDVATQE